jgi:hypothetical protein
LELREALYLQEYNVLIGLERRTISRRCLRYLAALCGAALTLSLWMGQAVRAATVTVTPDADSFVRSLAPTNNYGAGGALSVSGAAALNGTGDQNGLFDTVMRFPMSNVVASLDDAFGGQDWVATGVRLVVTEMAAPDNAIFNRGVGAFEIRWIANDSWVEGTGKPMTPTTDGAAWQDLPLLLNSNVHRSLGVFTNAGVDGQIAFTLAQPGSFLADVRSSGEVSLYLTASSPEVGFTFNSRNFGNTNAQPRLELTALLSPKAVIDSIACVGGNIVVSFSATTNWVYRLQRADAVEGGGPWVDVLTVPAQAAPTNIVYVEGLTNSRGFYRLSVSR